VKHSFSTSEEYPGVKKKIVLLDNDGVLVHTEALYFRATRAVLQSWGIELSDEQYRLFFLQRSGGAFHLARERGADDEEIARMREQRNSLYARLLEEEQYIDPAVEDVLAAVSLQARIGVVTSSRREHFRIIHSRTGFGRFFELVVALDDVRYTKPHPEPYLKALEILGCDPRSCVAVEDSERGVNAAKAAGIECWAIPTEMTRASDFSAADRVLASLRQVIDLL
jgi:HAD superfamily hydrolase (TIGR01509 family)